MKAAVKNPKDTWIPRSFFIFFAVIVLADGIFAYIAVSTQTGLVTENPYEKGLAFNETLDKAKAQPVLENTFSYQDGVLRWSLPMENASVTASIVRPVQDGYDFDIMLSHVGGGVYEARVSAPLPGQWTAHLKAIWDDQEFQTSATFIAK